MEYGSFDRVDDRASYAPEMLFTQFQQSRAARFAGMVERYPLATMASYVLISWVFVLLATLGQISGGSSLWADVTPHAAAVPLAVGLTFFRVRHGWLPLLTYAVAVPASVALHQAHDPGYFLWATGAGLVVKTSAFFAAALILAALLGKAAAWIVTQRGWGPRADVTLVAVTSAAIAVLGGAVTLSVPYISSDFNILGQRLIDSDVSLSDIAILRFIKLGAASGLFLLLFLETPRRKHLAVLAFGLALGAAFSVADLWQIRLHPGLDVVLALLLLINIMPAYEGVVASTSSLMVYEAVTRHLSRPLPITTHSEHIVNILGALALVLLLYLAALRFWNATSLRRSRVALARLAQVQRFARVGYFVGNTSERVFHVDPTAAELIGLGQAFSIERMMQRVPPADHALIREALEDRTSNSRHLGITLSIDPVWTAERPSRFLSVFVWYDDRQPTRTGRLAYGAILDMTEENEREAKLRSALAQLSDQQNRQTQLFSIVSHELRTPASLIAMLLDEMDAARDWEATGPRLRGVTEQLLSVLADMRQAVRPDQNLPVVLEPVVPIEKLERLRNNFALLSQKNGMAISIRSGGVGDGVPQMLDRTRINQAMSNLIRNAILHSGGRNVFIGYDQEVAEGGVVGIWTVGDDGTGIPAAKREALFKPFSRLEPRKDRVVDGSGLGLYVVRSSMELLGGTVSVGDRPGGGTLFRIALPVTLATLAPVDSVAKDATEDIRLALKTKSVLVAEDSELMAELLERRLQKLFGRVTMARTGRDALDLMRRDAHDVVLTDLFMPELTGDELTRILRREGFAGPIVGMTAASIGEDRTSFETAGTDAMITKPVRMEDFIRTLGPLLAQAPAEPALEGGQPKITL